MLLFKTYIIKKTLITDLKNIKTFINFFIMIFLLHYTYYNIKNFTPLKLRLIYIYNIYLASIHLSHLKISNGFFLLIKFKGLV